MPTTSEIGSTPVIGACECSTCGQAYDFEATGAEFSDQCPACQAREEAAAAAEEAREEAVAEVQGEVEEAESDLEGLLEEMRELRERIAEAKATVKSARRKLATLAGDAVMRPLPGHPVADALLPSMS